jgi:integrase/recombinase XerD
MKYIIIDGVVLSRPLEGPLAAHIESFARWGSEQGYSLCTLHRQVLLAAQFSRWLGQKRVRLRSISSQHTERYLRSRGRRVQINRGDAATLAMKEKALAKTTPRRGRQGRYRPGDRLLAFLNTL